MIGFGATWSPDFPWQDIEIARQPDFQPVMSARGNRPDRDICPHCGLVTENFWFCSPATTWKRVCGRAGWLTVCDNCQQQISFQLQVMN